MHQERTIRSFDGTLLHVHTVGHGPPLIFCDGLGCDGYIWKYLTPVLAGHFRLIFWHYRGHGKSCAPAHPHAHNLVALRDDLMQVMNALDVHQATLLGHSMGVQLLLELALYAPERVKGLVLLCGGPGRPLDTLHGNPALGRAYPYMHALIKAFPKASQKVWRALWRSNFCHLWAQAFEVNSRLIQKQDLQPYFDHLHQMDIQFFMQMLGHLQEHTVVGRLGSIHTPTLIVAGEMDTLTPLRLSQIMQRRLSDAQLVVVPDGTHVAPLERPELVNGHVMSFVRRLANAV